MTVFPVKSYNQLLSLLTETRDLVEGEDWVLVPSATEITIKTDFVGIQAVTLVR
jgi:hypothetical protein